MRIESGAATALDRGNAKDAPQQPASGAPPSPGGLRIAGAPEGAAGRSVETFDSRLRPESNNFDLIRLVAALLVVLGHSYSLSGNNVDPLTDLTGVYSGTLAVSIFFVISGFLVYRSLQMHKVSAYLRARLLRIIPGLALVTLVEAYLIGPYFFDGDSMPYYYSEFATHHLRNIFVFGEDPYIPGVFTKLRYPFVNGSLWSLPVESIFYLLLPILGLLTGGRRWVWLALFIASLAAEPVALWAGLQGGNNPGPEVFRTVRVFPICEFVPFFLGGVACWAYREKIPWTGGLACVLLLAFFAAHGGIASRTILKLALPYLVLFVGMWGGFGTALKKRIGDLSYGVYLIGYPAINSILAIGGARYAPMTVFALAALASIAYASLSWWLVEKQALKRKA